MDNQERFNLILNSFKIKAKCISYSKIRNISLYDLVLEPGTKVKGLQRFSDEISLAMKAQEKPLVRIIPKLGIIRFEVIDEPPHKLLFFDGKDLRKSPEGDISMYLGSSINGDDMWIDMAKNPHILISGCTGSGKSTLLQVIMANALKYNNIKICLIDSKNVEFNNYDKFSNVSIATDYASGLNILSMLLEEMDYRYKIMNTKGIYNKEFPNILFIIDEFADLIMQDNNKIFLTKLCKLAQKSRAASIYCVVATQRPSVDIISGSIKANFPARISCQVASGIDSKVILDTTGAELLAGSGDAIIKNYNNNYQRFQSAYTTSEEVCKYYDR